MPFHLKIHQISSITRKKTFVSFIFPLSIMCAQNLALGIVYKSNFFLCLSKFKWDKKKTFESTYF